MSEATADPVKIITPHGIYGKYNKFIYPLGCITFGFEGISVINKIHAPYIFTAALLFHILIIFFSITAAVAYASLFYRIFLRSPRIELSPAGIAMIGSYGRRQFWSWSALGPFRRGAKPYSIEAPRTDDPSARVYLPEWTLQGDDRLVTVLNNYRAGLK